MKPPKPAPLHLLERQYTRAVISRRDFKEARDFLGTMGGMTDHIARRGLLISAIVSYAPPFTVNRPGANEESTTTFGAACFDGIDGALPALHARVLDLRNTVVAHSDFDARPMRRAFYPARGFASASTTFDILEQGIDLATFDNLAGWMFHSASERAAGLNALINAAIAARDGDKT